MNELFNKVNNPLFHIICKIINEIHSGHQISKKEIRNRIRAIPCFRYAEAPEDERELSIINKLFVFGENDPPDTKAKLYLDEPVPPLITAIEQSWLKSMLLDKKFTFLLPSELRSKLLLRLENVPPLYTSSMWQGSPEPDASLDHLLGHTLEAMETCHLLSLDNQEVLLPYRLEYDLATGDYALIAWHEAKGVILKLPLAADMDLKQSTETYTREQYASVAEHIAAHQREVTLRMKPTRNAIERCFLMFGTYDKLARIDEDDTYLLVIYYYDFEEEELFQKIMSLNTSATIVEPESIRNNIIGRISQAASLYLTKK